jgi:sugar lactone lactonase YvrE
MYAVPLPRPLLLSLSLAAACAAGPAGDPAGDPERGAAGKADAITGSCDTADWCGGEAASGACYCDDRCAHLGDCCADAAEVCGVATNRLADRTAGEVPLLGPDALETAIDLPFPPGNVSVSSGGRVFFSFHPDGNKGDVKIAELAGGEAIAFPDDGFQDRLRTPLGIRVDAGALLWILDHGKLGFHRPRLYAVDIDSGALVLDYEFPRTAAPIGSFLNDLQVDPGGEAVYISDPSPIAGKPAIVVVDLTREHPIARRRLVKHPSVADGPFDVFVDDVLVRALGIRPDYGVDGLALDPAGEHLYYSSLNSGELHRIATADLRFELSGLTDEELAPRVETVSRRATMTDGMIADAAGNIYLTDMEHHAITRVKPGGELELVIADHRLRWPDGLSAGPGGGLYVTASALHQYMPELHKSRDDIAANAPYQIFKLALP